MSGRECIGIVGLRLAHPPDSLLFLVITRRYGRNMTERKKADPNGQPHRFHIDWTMLGVVVALLAFFAVMWTHLSGRIDDVQAAGSERVDAVHSTLREISETLGRLDQRTQKIDDINAKLDRLLESVTELRSASHTHTAPDIQSQPR